MEPTVVVPCFNEERRLRLEGFEPLLAHGRILFVDNGSTDGTASLLRAFAARSGRVRLLSLPADGGKAEAVRRGLLAALEQGAGLVGYLDADLATPAEEMLRVIAAVQRGEVDVALGSRAQAGGGGIDRTLLRRLLGRCFAVCAAAVLGVPLRDTQCGAKAFRDSAALRAALAKRFSAHWVFDVELLGRMVIAGTPAGRIVEIPLREWRDVPGSKLRPLDFPRMGLELWRVHGALARRRREVAT